MKSLRSGALYVQTSLRRHQHLYESARLIRSPLSPNAVVYCSVAYRYVRFFQHISSPKQTSDAGLRLSNPGEIRKSYTQVEYVQPLDVSESESNPPSASTQSSTPDERNVSTLVVAPNELPLICPGCGAYSQTSQTDEPGYYSIERNDVQIWLAKQNNIKSEEDEEMDIVERSLANLDPTLLESLGISNPEPTPKQQLANTTPICGRCHALIHQNDLQQQSIIHPSLDAVRAFLEESPYKRNHIYHVIDSADFPMSLIPQMSKFFDIAIRSKNRRAKSYRWAGGQQNEMSFVITRADLIARNLGELEKMMPYLQAVIHDALGKHGENVRLGNLWAVSARQGWWTKALKEEVYKRGGGGWLVGKVNVGKSALYEAMFPKGYKNDAEKSNEKENGEEESFLDDSNPLLPPLPPETKFPAMPTVSPLPGTTALPVRNAFGNGKGELIDLPGLPRNGLYEAVNPHTAPYLYHGQRISAEQYSIQAGSSLVVSNLIQIKPIDPSLIILAAPFVPLRCSVRENDFAKSILDQTRLATTAVNLARNTATPETASTISSAGTFKLSHNITKERTGPLTRSDAADLRTSVLPFEIFGTDILIEGVGWVELTCQVRKRYLEEINDPEWAPEVEVFSPHGKYIGVRRPMNAYLRIGNAPKPKSRRSQRPRRSMKGVKKEAKRKARAMRASERSAT